MNGSGAARRETGPSTIGRNSATTRRSSVAREFPQSSRWWRACFDGDLGVASAELGNPNLLICQRTVKRARIQPEDRLILSGLCRCWVRWVEALVVVQPATVIAWQQKRFSDHCVAWDELEKPG